MTRERWADARDILCVRLDSMGDVLMTTPAIAALKESRPSRRVTLLTSPAGAEAARLVTAIDQVLIYEAPWMKTRASCANSAADWQFIEQLRDARFDAAVIFTVSTQSALPAAIFCHLAGIPLSLGHCRENPYRLLTDWLPDRPEDLFQHEVERQLDLVAYIGATTGDVRLRLEVPERAGQRIAELLRQRDIDASRPWVVMHPGASASSRRYPPEEFAEVAAGMQEAGHQVVFTGSEGERDLVRRVQLDAGGRTASFAGCLDLSELAALLSRSSLLISNNTGPVHVASAVGTPVVDIYAMTNPQHTPWRVPNRVLTNEVPCGFCFKSVCMEGHHACLRGIAPEKVISAALELLAECRAGESRPGVALR